MVELIIGVLIFGAGMFLAGWGLGRWAIEPHIDDLEYELEMIKGDQNIS